LSPAWSKDAFSLWLNQHTADAERIAELCISNAQRGCAAPGKVVRKKVTQGPALPGKLADCTGDRPGAQRAVPGGGRLRRRQRQAGPGPRIPGHHAPARQDPEHLGGGFPAEILGSQEVHDIAVALGVDPAADDLSRLRYGKVCILADADSDGAAHRDAALRPVRAPLSGPLVAAGHVFVAMPPLYRIDVGKEVFYALDDAEKQGILDRIAAEKIKGKVNVQRFKGLGEMNPCSCARPP
jgi:topoisomerase-4 subunit B